MEKAMAELHDPLLELRYVGIDPLPEAGDAGDRRLQRALDREMGSAGRRRREWTRRRVRIGGFAVPTVAMLTVAATAAAATTAAVVSLNATSLFQHDPQGRDFGGDIETVLPSTVRMLTSVTIPDYGQVEVWGANTQPGGFCFALRLPDGNWGGLHLSQDAADGWAGGSIPGCFQTRQQQILKQTPLQPGQQPNGATGQELEPLPLDVWDNLIKNGDGNEYALYIGYVEAQGTATTVRDPDTGATAQVMPDGYYVLPEPTSSETGGNNAGDLQVLDAAGQPLKPDYTWGHMVPGYSPGPSQS